MATRLLPESAEALHSRGLLYQRQGMHPQAILDFDATIDRNPFVGAPYAARGQSLWRRTSSTRPSRTSTRPSTSTRTPIPGPGAASPTSARATARGAIESYQRALAIDNGNTSPARARAPPGRQPVPPGHESAGSRPELERREHALGSASAPPSDRSGSEIAGTPSMRRALVPDSRERHGQGARRHTPST